MKPKIYFLTITFLLTILSCKEVSPENKDSAFLNDQSFEGMPFIIDTLMLSEPGGNNILSTPKLSSDFLEVYKDLKQSNESFIKLDNALIDEICPSRPKTMAELSDGIETTYYKFTKDNTVDLKLFGWFGPKIEKNQVLLITDFIQHSSTVCNDGKARDYGVGVRLYLYISKKRNRVSLELPKLAANVELNRAVVTYKVKTIGITGDKVIDALPKSAEFNVENYAKVTSAIDKIVALAKDNTKGVIIDPQLLPE